MSAPAINDWRYLKDTTLITIEAEGFTDRVQDIYLMLIEAKGHVYTPSVSEIADIVDGENVRIIEMFYEYQQPETDIAVGNYMTEMSFEMESWVETALMRLGYPYSGCSVELESILRKKHSPQNILFPEFLR